MGPGLMTAIEPAATQPYGQGQLPWDLCWVAPSAINPCSRTVVHLGAALPLLVPG